MSRLLRAPRVIVAPNPDTALMDGLWLLKTSGLRASSRNGSVLVAPAPVITSYPDPRQRVIFSGLRDANPFFHLYEACWMLAGRFDSASVARFASQMESFAEDGQLWGAYGWRWRSFFEFDQLHEIIDVLRHDRSTRRAVLTMWAPSGDLIPKPDAAGSGIWASKDVPCNTHVYFDASKNGELDMTVCNRSNDIVWGAYGANVVHMSYLHEFVAAAAGLELGHYHQVSNNYHLYTDRPDVQRLLRDESTDDEPNRWQVLFKPDNRYLHGVKPFQLVDERGFDPMHWLGDCEELVNDPYGHQQFDYRFFQHVVSPMMEAHEAYKQGDFELARHCISKCIADDWRVAGAEWIERRQAALRKKAVA